jgi:hypothetical protein
MCLLEASILRFGGISSGPTDGYCSVDREVHPLHFLGATFQQIYIGQITIDMAEMKRVVNPE